MWGIWRCVLLLSNSESSSWIVIVLFGAVRICIGPELFHPDLAKDTSRWMVLFRSPSLAEFWQLPQREERGGSSAAEEDDGCSWRLFSVRSYLYVAANCSIFNNYFARCFLCALLPLLLFFENYGNCGWGVPLGIRPRRLSFDVAAWEIHWSEYTERGSG